MIEIKNLHKYFNRFKKNKLHVIDNVSLKLPNKGLVALLGPSGSGKTTMLNMIGGLDKQTKGTISINHKKLTKRSNLKRDFVRTLNIGYIFQDYKLIDEDSVYDNVALSLKLLGVKNKKEIKRRVEFILEKLNIYRYRYRPSGMLSGGERQRVGIARALVKDPDIILADEPTGNLDSKNTIEVMNIISEIAKEKLVILVTHEQNLAKFYADRIIEFKDGCIQNDYKNEHPDDLDYQIENKIYLKDFKYQNKLNKDNLEVNIYSNEKSNIKIDIVVKNGNYFIKTNNNYLTQIVDDDSSVEFINDKYKKINRNEIDNMLFDAEKIENKKYGSIFNIFTLFYKGFQRVFNYSFLKKLLLIGFLLSGGFILYATSSYYAAITIKDEQFIETSRDYTIIKNESNKASIVSKVQSIEPDAFIIPGDAQISANISVDKLMQFSDAYIMIDAILTPLDNVSKSDLIYGRMPENDHEILIDKLAIKREYENVKDFKMLGYKKVKDMLNETVQFSNAGEYKIVGITNKVEPCIYINKDLIIPILAVQSNEEVYIHSYSLNKGNLKLVKGREPINDYEVIVNIENRYEMPLKKKIDYKINNKKLTVVGYYKPINNTDNMFVNDNTIEYELIDKTNNILINNMSENIYVENGYSTYSTYDLSKDIYKKQNKESVDSKMFVSAVIIAVSLVEAFLISRSSFLSKVKEVGTYRAIGVKRKDICKMFMGEAFAITTIASIPGILFTTYLLRKLIGIKYFKYTFIINFKVVILSIIIVYIFNIIVSLLPVFNLIRKTPAEILSRNDVD